jgi:hypothetical protein
MKNFLLKRFSYSPFVFYNPRGEKVSELSLLCEEKGSFKIIAPKRAVYKITLFHNGETDTENQYIRIENQNIPSYIGSIHTNSSDHFEIPLIEGENTISVWHTSSVLILNIWDCHCKPISEEIYDIFFGEDLSFYKNAIVTSTQGWQEDVKGYTLRFSEGGDFDAIALYDFSKYAFLGKYNVSLCCCAPEDSEFTIYANLDTKKYSPKNLTSSSHQNCKYFKSDFEINTDYSQLSVNIVNGVFLHIGAILTHRISRTPIYYTIIAQPNRQAEIDKIAFDIKGKGKIFIDGNLVEEVDSQYEDYSFQVEESSLNEVEISFVGDFSSIIPRETSISGSSNFPFTNILSVLSWDNKSKKTYPYMFKYQNLNIELNIPEYYDTISERTFYYCRKDYTGAYSPHLIIPRNIKFIEKFAFQYSEIRDIAFLHNEEDFISLAKAGADSGIFYSKTSRAMTIYTDNPIIRNYDWTSDNIVPTFKTLAEGGFE